MEFGIPREAEPSRYMVLAIQMPPGNVTLIRANL